KNPLLRSPSVRDPKSLFSSSTTKRIASELNSLRHFNASRTDVSLFTKCFDKNFFINYYFRSSHLNNVSHSFEIRSSLPTIWEITSGEMPVPGRLHVISDSVKICPIGRSCLITILLRNLSLLATSASE